MKVYTKTGDKGTTSLIGGRRVKKNDAQIEAYGTIDELNSFVGLLRSQMMDGAEKSFLLEIQKKLFVVGGMLAMDNAIEHKIKMATIQDDDVLLLETEIDRMSEKLPPLKDFVIPGESPLSALCHVCRTIARRAERRILTYSDDLEEFEALKKYVNRLSDYFFVLSRQEKLNIFFEKK